MPQRVQGRREGEQQLWGRGVPRAVLTAVIVSLLPVMAAEVMAVST